MKEVDHMLDRANKNLSLTIVLLTLSFFFFSILYFTKCGTKIQTETVTGQCSDGSSIGSSKDVACKPGQSGKITYVCQADGEKPTEVVNTCQDVVIPTVDNSLESIESDIQKDQKKYSPNDRRFIRWVDIGYAGQDNLKLQKKAVDKTLNSINSIKSQIVLTKPINEIGSIVSFDLRDFNLSREDWVLIERADPLDFQSRTAVGQSIAFFADTRKPWIHGANLADVVMANPNLYYRFMHIPKTSDDLEKALGVNLLGDLLNADARLIGFNGSSIAQQKNRLIGIWESNSGSYFRTFDTSLNDSNNPLANLFKNPLFAGLGSKLTFLFRASEVIFSMPNGLHGYALFDGKGNLLGDAGLDIVRDNLSNVSPAPSIEAAISCFRCHSNGIIWAQDQIRGFVSANAAQFTKEDQDKIFGLYAKKAVNDALIANENQRFQIALNSLGITVDEADPINSARDVFRLDWDVNKVAGLLFLSPDEFSRRLKASQKSLQNVGQLLSGGTVTFATLTQKDVLDDLKREIGFLDEPVKGGE